MLEEDSFFFAVLFFVWCGKALGWRECRIIAQKEHKLTIDEREKKTERSENKILQNSFIFILQLRLLLPFLSVVIQIISPSYILLPNQREREQWGAAKESHKMCIKKAKKHFRWILKAIVCLMRSCRRFSHLNNNFFKLFFSLCVVVVVVQPFGFLAAVLRWIVSVLLCSFAGFFFSFFSVLHCIERERNVCLMICNAMPFVFHSTTFFFAFFLRCHCISFVCRNHSSCEILSLVPTEIVSFLHSIVSFRIFHTLSFSPHQKKKKKTLQIASKTHLSVSIGRRIATRCLNVEQNLWLCLVIEQIGNANVAGHRVDAEVSIGIARVDRVTNCLASCEIQREKRQQN